MIFPLVVIEGPIVTFLSGYLSSIGLMNIIWSFLVIILADTTSDLLHYCLGYYGGNKLVEKYGHYVNISAEKAEAMSRKINKNKVKTIFGKIIYGVGGIPIVACGLAKVPILEFLSISIFVSVIQISLYLSLGYYFGEFYDKFLKYFDYGGYIFGGIALIMLGLYIYLNKKRQ